MPSATTPQQDVPQNAPHIAIIGAGIAGINLALGLLPRKIPFTIYERAPSFREIGAGIGFSPNSERAMASLSAETLSAFKKAANPNQEDYFQWVFGFGNSDSDDEENKPLYKLHVGKDGFQGSRRSDILEAWAKLIPEEFIKFGKELDAISDNPNEPVILKFKDGTTAQASAVIACDGIRSSVRDQILSQPLPPGYTQKFCFRTLVPMTEAKPFLGEYNSTRRIMYNGPGAHIITYPVAFNSFLNILVVVSDSEPWPDTTHTIPDCEKNEVTEFFKGWNKTVRSIVELLPERLEKWAIFDMAENPAPYYSKGRVCIAGDAAHATGPHLGAGGGLGVEDALCLSGLLEAVAKELGSGKKKGDEAKLVEKALKAYNDVRYERTQWVVKATREAVDLFHWTDPRGKDQEEFAKEITERFHRIWEYDVDGMVREAVEGFRK